MTCSWCGYAWCRCWCHQQLLGLVVGLAIMGLALASCGSKPRPVPPVIPAPLPVEIERVDCLDLAPPGPRQIDFAGPAEDCPQPWTACLSLESAVALAAYIGELQRWIRDAWIRCGPEPVKEKPP